MSKPKTAALQVKITGLPQMHRTLTQRQTTLKSAKMSTQKELLEKINQLESRLKLLEAFCQIVGPWITPASREVTAPESATLYDRNRDRRAATAPQQKT